MLSWDQIEAARHPRISRLTDAVKTYKDVRVIYDAWLTESFLEQRFGQYVCNNYLKQGISWPELFYNESTNKANTLILKEIRVLL